METDEKLTIPCDACGARLKVPAHAVGRRVACPKCGQAVTVGAPEALPAAPPAEASTPGRIDFHCSECGQHLKVASGHAGKRIRCPKCQAAVTVPAPEAEPAAVGAGGGLKLDDLVAVERTQASAGGGLHASGSKSCPGCSTRVPGDAVLCTSCGWDFRSGQRVFASPASGPADAGEAATSGVASAARSILLGCALCAVGAAVGAGIWYGVAMATGFEIGWIAWGVGVLSGGGMYLGARASNPLGGVVAAGVAVAAIFVAKLAIFYAVLNPILSGMSPESVSDHRESIAYDVACDTIGAPPSEIDEDTPEFKAALATAESELVGLSGAEIIARFERERVVDWKTREHLVINRNDTPAAQREAYREARRKARAEATAMTNEQIQREYGARLAELRDEVTSARNKLQGSYWSLMYGPIDIVFVVLALVTAYRFGAGGVGMGS